MTPSPSSRSSKVRQPGQDDSDYAHSCFWSIRRVRRPADAADCCEGEVGVGDDAAEFLRRHRVSATPKELNAALARAVAARRVMLRELAPSELTEGEIEVLRAGGFLVEPCFPPG